MEEERSDNNGELGDMPENSEKQTPKPPATLLTMDENAMRKIMVHVDFKSIMTLRKVCHPLRNFLKTETSNINLERLTIEALSPTEIRIRTKTLRKSILIRGISRTIIYRKTDEGCEVVLYEGPPANPTVRKNINLGHCEAFLNDFKIILDHQKSALKYFEIRLREVYTDDQIFNKLSEYFNLRDSELKVAHFEFGYKNRLISIIPFLEPVTLRVISVLYLEGELDFTPLLELEQWKRAEIVEARTGLNSTPLDQFTHLVMVGLKRRTITLEEIKFLKETFLSNHKIQNFVIELENLNEHEQEIYDFLGPDSTDQPDFSHEVWVFRVPESDRLLEIRIFESEDPWVQFSRKYEDEVTEYIIR